MAPSGSPSRTAAFFDVDGTLVDSTIAHYYRYFMLLRLSPLVRCLWHAAFLAKCLYYIVLDRIDRRRFNVAFYRNYAGLPVGEIKALAGQCHRDLVNPRRFTQAAECVAAHRRAGDAVVLVTGSLDFIIEPLAGELGATAVLAASLAESDGRFTGALTGPPVGAEEKMALVRRYAAAQGIDLARSHAYGDSSADLPMLQAVGFPHAVNPDRRLAATARARGWPIHAWSTAKQERGDRQ